MRCFSSHRWFQGSIINEQSPYGLGIQDMIKTKLRETNPSCIKNGVDYNSDIIWIPFMMDNPRLINHYLYCSLVLLLE